MSGIKYRHFAWDKHHEFQPTHHRLAFEGVFTATIDPRIHFGAEYTPDFIAEWLFEHLRDDDWRIGHSGTIFMKHVPQALDFKMRWC
ncbi:MAG: hypothetical protein EOP83_01365 [Verrucomicrobiaceae bacterium]|nr:MAG: hypothetical protein EOP83_01365 [Verrucomicrobiaceae bacterium]